MQHQQQQQQSNSGGGGVPVSEAFWSLVHKADKKFSKIRDHRSNTTTTTGGGRNNKSRQESDAYFYKVFNVYTQLWKFQQDHRQKLLDAGLARSDIGEIASRIAQLYFGHYISTSQSSYLRESFVFYDAILSRDYFNANAVTDLSLASKHLRFVSRFLTVCLLLNRRQTLRHLLNHLRVFLDDCAKIFQETDFKEWKQVVQELVRFLKADSNFMNIRPLRYSIVLDPDPESLKSTATRNLRLQDAVLSSYHHNEVKFSELTLDTFRMLQCLEWESSGAFYQPSFTKNSQNGSSATSRSNYSQDIADPTLPPNPRKAVLYRPSVTHFLSVVATICEELPPDGVLLIYLSSSGGNHTVSSIKSEMDSLQFESERPNLSSRQSKEASLATDAGCLQFGGNDGVNCIYPSDLVPFTRRPLFLVIDGDNNDAFEAINGREKGETAAILLSPSISYHCSSTDSHDHPTGSLFTVFLTAPLQALCLFVGISGSTIDMDTYSRAENLLSSSFTEWGSKLIESDDLHPVWEQILGDPFLRRLVLRFVFCRAVLALYAPSLNKKKFIPRCVPSLPESLLPSTDTCQTVVVQIVKIFGATSSLVISEGLENIHGQMNSMPTL